MVSPLTQHASDKSAKLTLRQRQKTRRRSDIIAAANNLFLRQGYSATNMEEIAEEAEVGVATVYNYFGSKGQLLAEVLQPDLDVMFEQGAQLLKQTPEDPVTGMLMLVDIYCHFQNNWGQKDILRSIIGPGLAAEPILDEVAANAELIVKQQVEVLLSIYQKRNLIRPAVNITDAATIIFYIFNQHFIEYVTGNDTDFEKMKQGLDRQVSFIMMSIQVTKED